MTAPLTCGHCGARLDQPHPGGAMLRTRGLVVKASGLVLICPKCKGDVTPSTDIKHQLILFLKLPPLVS